MRKSQGVAINYCGDSTDSSYHAYYSHALGEMKTMVPTIRNVCFVLLMCMHAPLVAAQTQTSTSDSTQPATRIFASISLSGAATRATSDADKLAAEAILVFNHNPGEDGPRHQRSRLTVGASYDGKKKGSAAAIITRSYTGHAQHLVHLPGNRFFVSGNARYLHNNSLGIYLQQSYSALIGTRRDIGDLTIELDAGPSFVGQNFLGSKASTGFTAAALEELVSVQLNFIRPGTNLTETIRLALPLQSDDPWVGAGELTLFIPVSSQVTLTATAFDYYISNPPTDFEKNYFTTSFGVSISIS